MPKRKLLSGNTSEKTAPKPTEPFFAWSDAWVFAALHGSEDDQDRVDFSKVLAIGDMLNHSILLPSELRQGLTKLYQRGLVRVFRQRVTLLPLADELHQKVDRRRGGLFSVVDNCLRVLNSPRTRLPIVARAPSVEFLTEEFVHYAYEAKNAYQNCLNGVTMI